LKKEISNALEKMSVGKVFYCADLSYLKLLLWISMIRTVKAVAMTSLLLRRQPDMFH